MNETTTILIVDDDAPGRIILGSLLRNEGYQLIFAVDGLDALAQAAAQPPDLILLDVMMPRMDGYEVCRRVRESHTLAEVPIILLTALDDRDARLAGIESGADDFISKPFDRLELRTRVRSILRLNRYRRLLVERKKFAWVVDHADDGYLLVGEENMIWYANRQARAYLHLPLDDQAITMPLESLLTQHYQREPAAAWDNWLQQAATPDQPPRYLVRPASEATDSFWLQVDRLPMAMPEGNDGLIRLRDVTTQVVSQNNVWSFHSLIRHKFNTSLTHIIGALQMIEKRESALSAQMTDLLTIARKGAARLSTDVQAIFQYLNAPELAQASRGGCALEQLAGLFGEISAQLAITGSIVMEPASPNSSQQDIAMSSHALELVLWEVLANAKKFHPNGTPTVILSISTHIDYVELQLSDDGQSLTPDQLTRVWQPYYQGEASFTGQVSGMGLGLALVASLVSGVGGRYWMENGSEAGVTVVLRLPLRLAEPMEERVAFQ